MAESGLLQIVRYSKASNAVVAEYDDLRVGIQLLDSLRYLAHGDVQRALKRGHLHLVPFANVEDGGLALGPKAVAEFLYADFCRHLFLLPRRQCRHKGRTPRGTSGRLR